MARPLLVDNCLSPLVAAALNAAGRTAYRVRDLGLQDEDGVVILAHARREGFVVSTADTDFGTELARTSATEPSVIRLVTATLPRPADQPVRIPAVLPDVEDDLIAGAVVTVTLYDVSVTPLPLT